MKNYNLIILFLCLCSCQTKNRLENKTSALQPNILLIVVDDQGYADFSPFEGHDKSVVTPNISRLGSSGTVFSQAYVTAPVCSPSRAGILTGRNQFRWDKLASWGPGLPDSIKALPEYLKEAGYETAKIGKNDLGRNFHKNDVREYPLNHGFDEFLGFSAHAHDYWLNSQKIKDKTPDPFGTSALLGPLMYNMGEKSYNKGYLTEIFTDATINYLKQEHKKPFFLMLSYNAVHHLIHEVPKKYLDKFGAKEIANYDPDSMLAFENQEPGSYSAYYDKYSRVGAIKSNELRAYYLANLNCLDDNIGRVLDALEDNNLDENTLIVFVSDNGGSPLNGSNNTPLTGGKYSLWEGGIRVPLALVWPEHVEAGKVIHNYVSATDIMPTLINAAGAKVMDNTLDGISLLKPDPTRMLVWKWQKTWAVRQGDWKLTNAQENHWKSDPSDQYIAPVVDNTELKLFNISKDAGERFDLASQHPYKMIELQAAYKNWINLNVVK